MNPVSPPERLVLVWRMAVISAAVLGWSVDAQAHSPAFAGFEAGRFPVVRPPTKWDGAARGRPVPGMTFVAGGAGAKCRTLRQSTRQADGTTREEDVTLCKGDDGQWVAQPSGPSAKPGGTSDSALSGAMAVGRPSPWKVSREAQQDNSGDTVCSLTANPVLAENGEPYSVVFFARKSAGLSMLGGNPNSSSAKIPLLIGNPKWTKEKAAHIDIIVGGESFKARKTDESGFAVFWIDVLSFSALLFTEYNTITIKAERLKIEDYLYNTMIKMPSDESYALGQQLARCTQR